MRLSTFLSFNFLPLKSGSPTEDPHGRTDADNSSTSWVSISCLLRAEVPHGRRSTGGAGPGFSVSISSSKSECHALP